MTQLVTSVGSDGHSMTLTESGEVFSWEDGDYYWFIIVVVFVQVLL